MIVLDYLQKKYAKLLMGEGIVVVFSSSLVKSITYFIP